jgi:TolB-like protein/DNA-binding winged helix-turn-helix (wHTH) protein/Flp pilus assembly protein TadD
MNDDTGWRGSSKNIRDSLFAPREEASNETPEVYKFGPFRLEPAERKLSRNGEPVVLAPKAFDTLLLLVRNNGHLMEKDQLIGTLWPDSFVEEGNLSNNIFVLRKALGEDPQYIETVPKRGYRFVGAVRQLPSAAPRRTERSEEAAPAVAPLPANARQTWRSWAVPAAVVLIAALAFVGWFYRRAGASGQKTDSVAVWPFVNASADPDAEYLSDGFTESLINNLSRLPNLKVKSRNSVFRYKGKETDPRTVGRQLGVGAILEGRVARHGDSLAVSVELIDTKNDTHLWGRQYNEKITDIFAVQREIAEEMTAALRLRLSGEEEKRLARSYTSNAEAYEDYLRGRYLWNKRTKGGMNKGIEYFQRAIAKDPNYALAYDGVADCYILLPIYGYLAPNEGFPKAKEAALKSLELDDTLAEAHTSLARVKAEYDWDWAGADREFQRAIELNPRFATARQWYGDVLATMGRQEEAIEKYKQALELDPLSLATNTMLGQALYHSRRYDSAIEQLKKTLELDPNFGAAHEYLGLAYLQKSLYKESIEELEKGLVDSPDSPGPLWKLGYAYAVTGRSREAFGMLDKLNELSKRQYVPPVAQAFVQGALGKKNKAFDWLEKSYAERNIGLGGVDLKLNPNWDPLRSDPRFADLVRRVNL